SSPTATPTTAPTATPTGSQTATATPAATADPDDEAENVLYDDYLGTGMGPGQLSIVFDAEYAPKDYELHPVVMGDELFIRAKADEEGQFVRRSLILTARQIQRLHEESELTLLLFQNGGALALAQMDELYTGRMAKLIALGLEEGLSGVSLDGMDWDALPEPALTASQLSRARVEVLVIPQQLEDGREGFTIQVFLRLGEETLEVTELTESLTVCLNAETLITPENRETFAEHYAVALVNEAGESLLPSELRLLPDEVSEPFPDRSERFDVTILPGTAYPAVLYEPSAALRLYRVEALCAPYAGEGVYTIGER
ncbi:MAG: hypothetical protein Q4G52_11290, partial [Clostridia bacterium]|nr:hypothetical protein [Clostridia bacterium]